jgi:transcriptional regulator with XRE-family HTH domain
LTLSCSDLVALGRARRLVDTGQLRRVRHEAALTQSELAELAEVVGVSVASVCRWELGDVLLRSPHARKLTEVLGVLAADSD